MAQARRLHRPVKDLRRLNLKRHPEGTRRIAIIVSLILAMLVGLGGCATPKPPAPTEGGQPTPSLPTNVVRLEVVGAHWAADWDADPEIDGIELYIYPIDAQENEIKAPGIVDAKLWLQKSRLEPEKGELLQTWTGITVSEDDYQYIVGAPIRLEFEGCPSVDRQYGILELTFTTPDGKSFTATKQDIPLAE